jgi:arylsulfatase A-like enzyme
MIPQYLKNATTPYACHAVGKWHGLSGSLFSDSHHPGLIRSNSSRLSPPAGMFKTGLIPTSRGFDTYFGYLDGSQSYYGHDNSFPACKADAPANWSRALDLWNGTAPARGWDGVYSSEMYSAAFRGLIEAHDPATPMFLYLAFQVKRLQASSVT